jgi:hypothetical protein
VLLRQGLIILSAGALFQDYIPESTITVTFHLMKLRFPIRKMKKSPYSVTNMPIKCLFQ